ncbi:membrane dipeptidase [Pseudomonas sp. UBA2684]|uniref:membrane dipeptidase n=1 Tax=Pseudomonas sp. UBA2684 TaxID=1947311 RepID=UPI000E8B836B|nr:membrane dipeptidase [Pseudomonas sp. UBA2684]HBX56654.1 peptidase M19 [Pseudomonas sp.]|tara:strand:+ start:6043 stop:7032 length:990 start_codon:yes stop_codon:yes gene_type:complete
MHDELIVIDGLQYSNWDRDIFNQLREGGVSAVHATLVYHENARETLSRLGEWNRRFEQHGDLIMPVAGAADIRRAKQLGKVGVFFGAQNCSPIEDDIALIEVFRQLNLLIMQLTYNNQSLLASGCYEGNDSGITRFGKQAIAEMNRVGMLIDMSHSAERSTLEAIELSSRPIIISHANPAFFHPAKRNKSETVLRELGRSGGLLGFSLYPFHLHNGSACTLAQFCDMVARTADLMGIEHIGIGTDLCQNQPQSVLEWMRSGRWSKQVDYGEGSASNADWPKPLGWFGDSRDFPHITQGLLQRGFTAEDTAKVMGLNWLRTLEQGLEAAQ